MVEKTPYLKFSSRKPGATSLIFKAAAEKNTELMRLKTPEEHREAIERLVAVRPVLSGVRIEPVECGGVPCEWVGMSDSRSDKIIVYIHGGSWMTGSLNTAQMPAELLAEGTGYKVLVIDYRLAPEHPFPAGFEDCAKVFGHLVSSGRAEEDIALFGDSAGGNLSLVLLNYLKSQNRKLPRCVGLASPVTDMTDKSEIVRSRDDLIFTQYDGDETDIFSLYTRGRDRADPMFSPILADLSGLPPILLHVGGDEPLSVDCLAYIKKAYEQGVDAALKVYRGMFHDFSIVGVTLKESRDSMKEFAQFFKKHLG